MKFAFLSLLFLLPLSAHAEEVSENVFCKKLSVHKTANDVVYKPGVDVKGNAVVPADINSSPIKVPEIIKIPLEADLAQRLQSLEGTNIIGDAPLGMIEIHQDGKVIYEGEDISSNSAIICGHSQRIVTEVDYIQPEIEAIPVQEGMKAPEVSENPDAMTSFAEEKGLLEELKPQPKKIMTSDEIETELKSIVNDMNDGLLEGGEYRE